MYTIGSIVYGVIVDNYPEDIVEAAIDDGLIETPYHGAADFMPAYIGIQLNSIAEVDDVRVFSVKWMPTEEDKKKYADICEQIRNNHPQLTKLIDSVEPDVYIVWSTS